MLKFISILLSFKSTFCKAKSQTVVSDSWLYLGQKPPGSIAELFAPGSVSLKDRYEYGSVFSKDGREFYYAAIVNQKPQILMSKLKNSLWSAPVIILASTRYE